MKLSKTKAALLALLLLAFSFQSCRRDKVEWDGDTSSTVDNGFADSEFSTIRNIVDTEGRSNTGVYGKTTSTQGVYCPGSTVSVSFDTTLTIAYMTIDFGSGTNCIDGRLRTGILNAEFHDYWKNTGSYVIVTPTNYTVNGYAFSFTKTITNNGRNAANNLSWTVDVDNAVLTHPTQGTITWQSDRTTEWIEGEGDFDPTTNVYSVTGTSSGVSRNSIPFTAEITKALRVEASCKWITEGTWTLTPQNRETRTIDYGAGTCDDQATLSVGNYTANVTMP